MVHGDTVVEGGSCRHCSGGWFMETLQWRVVHGDTAVEGGSCRQCSSETW